MRQHRARHAFVLITVATALTLVGCSNTEPAAPAPSLEPFTTCSATARTGIPPSTAVADPAPTDAAPKTTAPGGQAKLTVTDIRIGRHEGFDRVVYELGGTGTPGWRVGYVDEAVQDGSGKLVPVAGNGILQVLIDGSAYPFDSGAEPYCGPDPVVADPGGVVTEVHGSGVFEGVTQSFVGVTEAGRPFRVSALTDPTRIVVDVAN